MADLDPTLSELLERRAPGPGASADPRDESVDVLVGLRRAADDDLLADLARRGLRVRSVIGDVLTGSVALDAVETVAACDDVLRLDAGGRLAPDDADDLPTT